MRLDGRLVVFEENYAADDGRTIAGSDFLGERTDVQANVLIAMRVGLMIVGIVIVIRVINRAVGNMNGGIRLLAIEADVQMRVRNPHDAQCNREGPKAKPSDFGHASQAPQYASKPLEPE